MPGGQCSEEQVWSEEGRDGGHLHANDASGSSLHASLCKDWCSTQVILTKHTVIIC